MSAPADRNVPLDLYVAAVIFVGGLCALELAVTGAAHIHRLLMPQVAIFGLLTVVGDLFPLKVFTRGAEGETTTSTCFAFATMLVAGPLAALIALAGTNLLADGAHGKPIKKIAFNIGQYA